MLVPWVVVTVPFVGPDESAHYPRARHRQWSAARACTRLAVAYPVFFFAWLYRDSGFGLQGRYVLPVLVLTPMLAGSLLGQSLPERPRLARGWSGWSGWAVTLAIAAVAILQPVAWCLCASNSASTGRSLSFLSHAAWAPPSGWTLGAVISALGAIALIAYGAAYLGAGGAAARRVRSADFVTYDGVGSPRVA